MSKSEAGFEKDFIHYLTHFCGVKKSEKLLVAVSAGVDSMTLAVLLQKHGYDIGVAHCNFCLRGKDSEDDAALVKHFAETQELPFHYTSFSTYTYAKEQKISIQMAARQLRFTWFHELLASIGYDKLCIAHHLDDSIETMFINFLRGTGIRGIRGLQPVNGKIIRPLMFATRQDIEKYAAAAHISFRTDASNNSDDYIRNRIRHHIIPAITTYFPEFPAMMTNNLRRISGTASLLDELVQNIQKQISQTEGNILKLNLHKLEGYTNNEELLFEMLHPYGFTKEHTVQIMNNIHASETSRFLSESHVAALKSGSIEIIQKEHLHPLQEEYIINTADELISETLPIRFLYSFLPPQDIKELKTDVYTILLDSSLVQFPLTLRRWKKGDMFYPFGMKSPKRVSDFFTDEKFTYHQKKQTWLLCSGKDIIWIVGKRADNRYRVNQKTRTVLRLSISF